MKKFFYLFSLVAFCFIVSSKTAGASPLIGTDITIGTSPVNDTVCSGTQAAFAATATDTSSLPLSYVWQVSTDGGTSWTNATDSVFYSGDSTDTLRVNTNLLMNGYKFRCNVTDTTGTSTSAVAMLTVIGIAPGAISGSSTVCKGSSVTLSDSVAGGIWSASNGKATITSGVVTGDFQGFDTLSYTDSNMCGMGVATFVVRVDTTITTSPISGPTSTCVGNTITLTDANMLGTWTWNASNGTATVTHAGDVTGAFHGMDTISYVFTNACNSITSTYVVAIDTMLASGSISGAATICAGSWTHLTETVTGGTWFSSSSAIAVVDVSGNVTGVSQGSVVISYYLSNSCGASVATHAMTVDTAAGAITGIDSVGVGDTRTLSDITPGGTWSSGDTSIAQFDSATSIVTGISVGSTNITYMVTNDCGTTSSVITLYVGNHPSPGVISGPYHVCIGHTITLSSSVPGGVWRNSNDTIATIDSVTGLVTAITVDSGMMYDTLVASYTYSNGFGDSTATYNVVIEHTPIIWIAEQPAYFALGQTYLIRATPPGGTWSLSNYSVGTITLTYDSVALSDTYATFVSYVVIAGGTDTIRYTATNPCGSADSFIVVNVSTVNAVKNINEPGFALNVYPNPNQGQFNIDLSGDLNEEVTVTVSNMLGESVEEFAIPTNKLVNMKLNEAAGIYLLSANTSQGKYTQRISITQ